MGRKDDRTTIMGDIWDELNKILQPEPKTSDKAKTFLDNYAKTGVYTTRLLAPRGYVAEQPPVKKFEFNESILKGLSWLGRAYMPADKWEPSGLGSIKDVKESVRSFGTMVCSFFTDSMPNYWNTKMLYMQEDTLDRFLAGEMDDMKLFDYVPTEADFRQSIAEKYRKIESEESQVMAKIAKLAPDTEFSQNLGTGFATMGLALMVSAITQSPHVAAVLFGDLQLGHIYLEARRAGRTPKKAMVYAVPAAVMEGALEYIGLDAFMRAGGSQLLKTLIRSATEFTQEFLQESAEEVIAKNLRPEQWEDFSSGFRTAFNHALYAGYLGAILGAGSSTMFDMANVPMKKFHEKMNVKLDTRKILIKRIGEIEDAVAREMVLQQEKQLKDSMFFVLPVQEAVENLEGQLRELPSKDKELFKPTPKVTPKIISKVTLQEQNIHFLAVAHEVMENARKLKLSPEIQDRASQKFADLVKKVKSEGFVVDTAIVDKYIKEHPEIMKEVNESLETIKAGQKPTEPWERRKQIRIGEEEVKPVVKKEVKEIKKEIKEEIIPTKKQIDAKYNDYTKTVEEPAPKSEWVKRFRLDWDLSTGKITAKQHKAALKEMRDIEIKKTIAENKKSIEKEWTTLRTTWVNSKQTPADIRTYIKELQTLKDRAKEGGVKDIAKKAEEEIKKIKTEVKEKKAKPVEKKPKVKEVKVKKEVKPKELFTKEMLETTRPIQSGKVGEYVAISSPTYGKKNSKEFNIGIPREGEIVKINPKSVKVKATNGEIYFFPIGAKISNDLAAYKLSKQALIKPEVKGEFAGDKTWTVHSTPENKELIPRLIQSKLLTQKENKLTPTPLFNKLSEKIFNRKASVRMLEKPEIIEALQRVLDIVESKNQPITEKIIRDIKIRFVENARGDMLVKGPDLTTIANVMPVDKLLDRYGLNEILQMTMEGNAGAIKAEQSKLKEMEQLRKQAKREKLTTQEAYRAADDPDTYGKMTPLQEKIVKWNDERSKDSADRQGIPLNKRRKHHVYHFFDAATRREMQERGELEEWQKISDADIPAEVVNKQLKKRLGRKKGLVEDFWVATALSIKMDERKIHFDPVVKKINEILEEGNLPPNLYKYITRWLQESISGRPSEISSTWQVTDKEIDKFVHKVFEKAKIKARPENVGTLLVNFSIIAVYDTYLGLYPVSAIKNFFQKVLVLPVVGEKYWTKGMVMGSTAEGCRLVREHSTMYTGRQNAALPSYDILGENLLKMTRSHAQRAVMYLFKTADLDNITRSFLAGYYQAKDYGLPEDVCIKRGDEVARKTQYLYNFIFKAQAFRSPPMRLLSMFTSWGINYVGYFMELARGNTSAVYADYFAANPKELTLGKRDRHKLINKSWKGLIRYLIILIIGAYLQRKTRIKALEYMGITSIKKLMYFTPAAIQVPLLIAKGLFHFFEGDVSRAKSQFKQIPRAMIPSFVRTLMYLGIFGDQGVLPCRKTTYL
jgi:hypothetical protein